MEDWVPAQVKAQPMLDLRNVALGPRGYKLETKRKFEDAFGTTGGHVADMEVITEQHELATRDPTRDSGRLVKPRRDTVGLARKSGRIWRVPATRASQLKVPPS